MSESDYRKLKRQNRPNEARFLTFSCFHRRPFLNSDRARQWCVDAIERARDKHGFDLWAWVLMPEHVHLLIDPKPDLPDAGPILNSIKQSVAKPAASWVRQHTPEFLPQMTDRDPQGNETIRFWQRGSGHDRNLWSPRFVWNAIDYIHTNPVERGLCDLPTDWPWSSAREYAEPTASALSLNLRYLPRRPMIV